MKTLHAASNMATSGLGTFAQFPPEIRDLIWDELYPTGDLSIMRASQQLREEIVTYLVYVMKRIEIEISPQFERDVWLRFYDCNHLVCWTLASVRDALARGLRYLPFNELEVWVSIPAPEPDDPGQLICLWKKTSDLVEFLNMAKCMIKFLGLRFEDTKRTTWVTRCHQHGERRLVSSIVFHPDRRRGEFRPVDLRADIEILLFPFCRLTYVQSVYVQASDEILHILPCQRYRGRRPWLRVVAESIVGNSHPRDADNALWDICEFYLECKLDILNGETAEMLRLERFAKILSNDSEYERRMLRIIQGHTGDLYLIDPIFLETKTRYRLALVASPAFCQKLVGLRPQKDKVALESILSGRSKIKNCEPSAWYDKFSFGLPPLHARF
jgi:hypothetical protein